MTKSDAFFYGTLMHPKILESVLKNDGSHLKICPAVLMEHTRHRVKDADYPGVVPYAYGRILCDRELSLEERSVRGTLVKGLTKRDLKLLDVFEGPEYTRTIVEVYSLGVTLSLSEYGRDDESLVPSKPPPLPAPDNMPRTTQAETYIFNSYEMLGAELWSFEDFVKNNAWKWYGGGPEDTEQDTEVFRRRAMLEAQAAASKSS